MGFAKVILVGNLGKDPDLRYTPQGDAVCTFSLATESKEKGGKVTTWWKVTLWRNQAETASKWLVKGKPVYIEGRPSIEEWTDRDGNKRFTLAVTGSDMQFISAGKDRDDSDTDSYTKPASDMQTMVNRQDDDIPF